MKQTLIEFSTEHDRDIPGFTGILESISRVAFDIKSKLSKSGLIEEQGASGETNVYGEEVQKLDAYANTVLTDALLTNPSVQAVGSEELAEDQRNDAPLRIDEPGLVAQRDFTRLVGHPLLRVEDVVYPQPQA